MYRAILALVLVCNVALAAEARVAPARNIVWTADATRGDTPPILGLAGSAQRYREHLIPQHAPPPAAPPADRIAWTTHDALLVTWGGKPGSGYAIAATTVALDAEAATVTLRCTAPDPDRVTTGARTHPAVLIPVPRRSRLVIRLTGDRAPPGVPDFAAGAGDGFSVIDDRR